MISLMDIRNLAQILGGDVSGRNLVVCPGPGHSRNDRSLAVRLTDRGQGGFIVHSFAGDDWRECRKYVLARLGGALVDYAPASVMRLDDARRRSEWANDLWHEAKDPRRTLAERYLNSRRLELDDWLAWTVLRFHPRCPWCIDGASTRVPALLAVFRSIVDDRIVAVQRVGLTPDGTKLDRRMLGPVRGAAVKLDALADRLTIGEGVETCMAARQLGYRVWALGSTGGIKRFPVLAGIAVLRILAENDLPRRLPNGRIVRPSADAVRECKGRWRRANRLVGVLTPPIGYKDANDLLMKRREDVIVEQGIVDWQSREGSGNSPYP